MSSENKYRPYIDEKGRVIVLDYFGHKFTAKEITQGTLEDEIRLFRVESIYDENIYGISDTLDDAIEKAKISVRNYG